MPEYTITQGSTEEIIAKNDDSPYRIRIFGAPVKITRTGDPRYSGDGLTYNVGYVGPIHNEGGARVFAENTGSGPDARIEIDSDLSAAGAFDPEQSGTQTVTDDGSMATDLYATDATTTQDSGIGSANAATLDLGDLRQSLSVHYDTTGAATLTVEVSADGSTWRTYDEHSVSSAESDVREYTTAYQHARAYLDANRTLVELSSKGV